MNKDNNYVAILAGGIGSRFWPESRVKHPKQFLDLLGSGKSLLQSTFERFEDICKIENIFVITHESYLEEVKKHLPQLADSNIIGEPFRKNTAPCAAYISHKILALNPKANILLCPSDHLIKNQEMFKERALEALEFVSEHPAILTLGIKPTKPDTGYGYIQYQTKDEQDKIHKVKTFTEKPNLELAKTFLKSGDFLWNSGIFAWNVNTIIAAFDKYLPEINEVFVQAKHVYNTDKEPELIEIIYAQCTNISIDYGIMEKAQNVYVLPSFFGWSDLGTWESAYEHSEKDYLGNVVKGNEVMIIDSSESMIKVPDNKLVVLQGLNNFIVIDTGDILLICERKNEQQIKNYVAEVKRQKGDKHL